MPEAQHQTLQIPPEVVRYMKGATPQSLQFDFLIGKWNAKGIRYDENGNVQLQYTATWRAEYLHDKRMVLDDFTVLAPTGQEVSCFVTLRTFSEITGRWELTGLAAFQPAMIGKWFGDWADGEMLLSAEAAGPGGATIKNKIRFHGIERDRFLWESHNSFDDGKTWIKVASLIATRSKS